MDEAGFATAHIVGNSLGGFVALQLAARGRARVGRRVRPGRRLGAGRRRPAGSCSPSRRRCTSRCGPPRPTPMRSWRRRGPAPRDASSSPTNFEHIPAELLAHQLLGVAGCTGAAALIEHALRERLGRSTRSGSLPGARSCGAPTTGCCPGRRRRALPRRLAAARRLGRARRRRPLPAARRPARGRAADPRLHGGLTRSRGRRRGASRRPRRPRPGAGPGPRPSAGVAAIDGQHGPAAAVLVAEAHEQRVRVVLDAQTMMRGCPPRRGCACRWSPGSATNEVQREARGRGMPASGRREQLPRHAVGRVARSAEQAPRELRAAEEQRRVVLPRRADAAVRDDVLARRRSRAPRRPPSAPRWPPAGTPRGGRRTPSPRSTAASARSPGGAGPRSGRA